MTKKPVDLEIYRNSAQYRTSDRDVPGTEVVAWIDALLRQERRALAAERCGSSQWVVIQENISHFEYVREHLLDYRLGLVTVTNDMIRAGREASRKHGAGAMREIFTAMEEARDRGHPRCHQ